MMDKGDNDGNEASKDNSGISQRDLIERKLMPIVNVL